TAAFDYRQSWTKIERCLPEARYQPLLWNIVAEDVMADFRSLEQKLRSAQQSAGIVDQANGAKGRAGRVSGVPAANVRQECQGIFEESCCSRVRALGRRLVRCSDYSGREP